MAIIKNPLIVISGGGGNQPTLFTPSLSIDYVTSILTISDGNGDFANYDLYYDNNGVWTLVGSNLSKNINLSTYFPTHNSDISLKVQAKGTDFISSGYSAVIVWAYGVGTPGLAYTLNSDNLSYSCSGIGTATETDIEIGSIYEGLPVTSVSATAFSGQRQLTSVTIPASITSFRNNAFYGCSSLDDVYYNGNIGQWLSIDFLSGSNPLQNVANLYINDVLLTTLVTPNDINSLGNFALQGCKSVTDVTVTDNIVSLGQYCFSASKISHLYIGHGVTNVAGRICYLCPLTSLQITNAQTIGEGAFRSVETLSKLILPDTLLSADTLSLSNMYALRKVIVKGANTTIRSDTFSGSNNIDSVYVLYSEINDYKTRTNWVNYASIMYPLVDTVADLSTIDTTAYTKACVVGNEEYTEYTYDGRNWNIAT